VSSGCATAVAYAFRLPVAVVARYAGDVDAAPPDQPPAEPADAALPSPPDAIPRRPRTRTQEACRADHRAARGVGAADAGVAAAGDATASAGAHAAASTNACSTREASAASVVTIAPPCGRVWL